MVERSESAQVLEHGRREHSTSGALRERSTSAERLASLADDRARTKDSAASTASISKANKKKAGTLVVSSRQPPLSVARSVPALPLADTLGDSFEKSSPVHKIPLNTASLKETIRSELRECFATFSQSERMAEERLRQHIDTYLKQLEELEGFPRLAKTIAEAVNGVLQNNVEWQDMKEKLAALTRERHNINDDLKSTTATLQTLKELQGNAQQVCEEVKSATTTMITLKEVTDIVQNMSKELKSMSTTVDVHGRLLEDKLDGVKEFVQLQPLLEQTINQIDAERHFDIQQQLKELSGSTNVLNGSVQKLSEDMQCTACSTDSCLDKLSDGMKELTLEIKDRKSTTDFQELKSQVQQLSQEVTRSSTVIFQQLSEEAKMFSDEAKKSVDSMTSTSTCLRMLTDRVEHLPEEITKASSATTTTVKKVSVDVQLLSDKFTESSIVTMREFPHLSSEFLDVKERLADLDLKLRYKNSTTFTVAAELRERLSHEHAIMWGGVQDLYRETGKMPTKCIMRPVSTQARPRNRTAEDETNLYLKNYREFMLEPPPEQLQEEANAVVRAHGKHHSGKGCCRRRSGHRMGIYDTVRHLFCGHAKQQFDVLLVCERCQKPQTARSGPWPVRIEVDSDENRAAVARVLPVARMNARAAIGVKGLEALVWLTGLPLSSIGTWFQRHGEGLVDNLDTSKNEDFAAEVDEHISQAQQNHKTDSTSSTKRGYMMREFQSFLEDYDPKGDYAKLIRVPVNDDVYWVCGDCCEQLEDLNVRKPWSAQRRPSETLLQAWSQRTSPASPVGSASSAGPAERHQMINIVPDATHAATER